MDASAAIGLGIVVVSERASRLDVLRRRRRVCAFPSQSLHAQSEDSLGVNELELHIANRQVGVVCWLQGRGVERKGCWVLSVMLEQRKAEVT